MEPNHQLDASGQEQNPANESVPNQISPPPMEVHHHAHHDHGKKSWKSYFWEFFMLFLAVFCGFLAENFREHYVEEKRVERQLKIMVDNLRYDTTRIGRNQLTNNFGVTLLDSLRKEVILIINGKKDYTNFYKLRYSLTVYGEPRFNSSAYTQLTTTGLLRLVKNDSLITNINDYYERVTYIVKAAVEATNTSSAKTADLFNQVTDQTAFHELITAFRPSFPAVRDTAFELVEKAVFETGQLKLIKADQHELYKLYNILTEFEVSIKVLGSRMEYAKQSAVKLIAEIEKTYH